MKSQIENFKQYLISQAKSQNTVRNYTTDITQYFDIFDTINRENVLMYKKKISNLATTTINCKLSSLKSFNEYLFLQNIVKEIFIIKADFIKVQNKNSNPINVTEEHVSKFLNTVSTKYNIYKSRNIAIIYLIANTGIRREEVTNIKLKDLYLENRELLISKGKGNKQRSILLNKDAIEVINDYLVDRAKHKFADSIYLFVSERSSKLHKDTINDIFDFYSKDGCKVNPHSLRHNYATATQEQGILTLPELQNQLGHSSIQTSGQYCHARKENIKKKINNLKIGK